MSGLTWRRSWGRQPKTATSVVLQAEGGKWQTARILIRHSYHGSVQCIQQPCVLRRYVTRLCRRDMTTEGWAGTSNCFFSWVQFWARGRGYISPTAGDRNKDIVLGGADVDGGHRGSCALDPELGLELQTIHLFAQSRRWPLLGPSLV